jgi:hypothetical protein
MKQFSYRSWAALLLLVFSAMACNLPFLAGQEAAPTDIPVSLEQAKQLEQQLQQSLEQAAQSGVLALEVNEEQLTSALNIALQQDIASTLPLEDVQVRLRDGKAKLTASTQQGPFKVPVDITAAIRADVCQIHFDVESAKAGPVAIPADQLDPLVKQAEQALTKYISDTVGGNVCFSSITIQDGKLSVQGQRVQ